MSESDVISHGVMILGFDLREPLNQLVSSHWDSERRSEYLIRPEIAWPASVDRAVWPSLADIRGTHPLNLWSSIKQILEATSDIGLVTGTGTVIQIGLIDTVETLGYWRQLFQGMSTDEDDYNIPFVREPLGYDIADRFLVSGLSNCMLSPAERDAVRGQWFQSINDYGLFSSPLDAASFRESANHLVPEHAPFFVYRIDIVQIAESRDSLLVPLVQKK